MKCISDELIQKHIDKETSAKENSLVQEHLSACSKCTQKVEESRDAANRIKELIALQGPNEIQIPEFREPKSQRKLLNTKLRKAITIASAACILISFLIIYQKPTDKIEYVYSYDVESDFNANLPLSEQNMVIEIIDSNGKLIKY